MSITNLEIDNNFEPLREGCELRLWVEAETARERKLYRNRFKKLNNTNIELINAVVNGDEFKVRTLVRNGANLETRNEYGYTVLMLAALNNHVSITEFLVESGANKSAFNEGRSAYLFARYMRHFRIVVILADKF